MKLIRAKLQDIDNIMQIIDMAKLHLKEQSIDQWQNGYPDCQCIQNDIANNTGFLVVENNIVYGYLCIDFGGEPAYDSLIGEWASEKQYVVVHRFALSNTARGKRLSKQIFSLVEEMALNNNITYFRVDTDVDNLKMQHILKNCGFSYRGTIWFDNSEKIAFDKLFTQNN